MSSRPDASLSRAFNTVAVSIGLFWFALSPAVSADNRPPAGKNNVWLHYNESDTVFVFVHGILSDSRSAWYYDGGQQQTYWPDLVATPSFGNPAVFLGGFYTEALSGSYTIRDAANELYAHLSVPTPPAQESVLDKQNIVFIAHSLGGIVVRHVLVRETERFTDKNVGLVLVASPSIGSRDADRLDFALELVQQEMGQQLQWKNDILDQLDRDFRKLVDDGRNDWLVGLEVIENHFYKEVLWIKRRVIVEEESGGRYFGEPIRIGNSDHSSIAKPRDASSQVHIELRRFYQDKFKSMVESNELTQAPVHGGCDPQTELGSCSLHLASLICDAQRQGVDDLGALTPGAPSGDMAKIYGSVDSNDATARQQLETLLSNLKRDFLYLGLTMEPPEGFEAGPASPQFVSRQNLQMILDAHIRAPFTRDGIEIHGGDSYFSYGGDTVHVPFVLPKDQFDKPLARHRAALLYAHSFYATPDEKHQLLSRARAYITQGCSP